jgi:hypothetical protein
MNPSHRKLAALAMPPWLSWPPVLPSHRPVPMSSRIGILRLSTRRRSPPNAIPQSRVLAIAHQAMYDAVRTIGGNRPAYAADLKATSGARAKADGVEIGAEVADALMVARNGDRSDAVVPFNPKPGAGRYR